LDFDAIPVYQHFTSGLLDRAGQVGQSTRIDPVDSQ